MASCKPLMGFPCGSDDKESACNVGDPGFIPGLGRSPGEGNGYPLQYSCLENPMDRGSWQTTVHKFTQSQGDLKMVVLEEGGRRKNDFDVLEAKGKYFQG